MPPSNSILSYADVQALLDEALEAKFGKRVRLESVGLAVNFRQRLYKFRQLHRAKQKEIFPNPSDPRHATSPYDALVFLQEEEFVIVRKGVPLEIEDLTE